VFHVPLDKPYPHQYPVSILLRTAVYPPPYVDAPVLGNIPHDDWIGRVSPVDNVHLVALHPPVGFGLLLLNDVQSISHIRDECGASINDHITTMGVVLGEGEE